MTIANICACDSLCISVFERHVVAGRMEYRTKPKYYIIITSKSCSSGGHMV
jgi:hypothetical protein